MKKVRTPWTVWQVRNLEDRQANETKHPYTCARCSNKLEPSTFGWTCREHGLIKNSWALECDTEGLAYTPEK